MIDQLELLKSRALEALSRIERAEDLEGWRVTFIGKRGELTQALRGLGTVTPEERPVVGRIANDVKQVLEAEFNARARHLQSAARRAEIQSERIDVTLPPRPVPLAQRHIISRVLGDIADAFVAMGYRIVEGPEVELDRYNFEALNIPKEHPARDMWDTFWVATEDRRERGEVLLRTHTSPMQVRIMERMRPPIRVIVPGRVYRYEATDATHESQFYQVEGLAVDRHLTLADLKGTLTAFVHAIFGPERRARFRCDYFPFVEPGMDVAVDCHVCHGAGCRLCKFSGWIEIMGAGMVHPNVLAGVGYDPSEYSGFAFGMGPERIALLHYGIDDIRLFYGNDLRFLQQFR